jgi:excisionase family DNA binding protein
VTAAKQIDEHAPANDVDTFTVDELASHLRLNRKTVFAMIQRGEIPGVRHFGRAIRVHRPTVVAWLAEGETSGPRSRRRR